MSAKDGDKVCLDGHDILLDPEGFMTDPASWTPAVGRSLAARDGIELHDDHWWLIEFVRDYHQRYGNPPLMRLVVGALRERQGEASSRDLYRLFPDGPVRLACKYGGLPKPDWCI